MNIRLTDLMELDLLEEEISLGYVTRRLHPEFAELAILNYSDKTQFDRRWNQVTKQTRGLIYNTTTLEILARSFQKFWNYGDDTHGQDLDPTRPILGAWDKADGSLGIQYVRPDGRPAIATRGSFESDQAIHATRLLNEDPRYFDFNTNERHPKTWLWEIVYPENRIVLDYHGRDELILLGSVDVSTGSYTPPRDNIRERPFLVQQLPATTLGEALALPNRENAEGMVIWFDRWTPIKLKQDDYVALHRIVSNLNVKEVWRQLSAGTYREFVEGLPDEFHQWAADTATELEMQYETIKVMAELFFENVKGLETRREFALAAKTYPASNLLFLMLDGRSVAPAIWKMLEPRGANGEL